MKTLVKTSDRIILRNDPQLPGITFRKFRGEEDYEAMAWIINSANEADGNDALATVEDITNNYAYLQRSDTDTDLIFVEDRGQAVGYGRCMWDKELEGEYLYSFFIHLHPDYRRDGIPLAMIGFLRSRLTVMAGEHPADAPKFLQSWGNKGLKWQEDLMEQLGLKPVRYSFIMLRPCSEPVEVQPLPEGIEVRPVGPEDYRAVFDAEAEAFKDHWGYVAPTENDFERFINSSNFDPSLWKVAWDGDQVVGQVLNFIDPKENKAFNRKRGYTEDISVRRPWRRRGVARALLTQSVKMFQDMGFEETSLGVDTENPNGALQLYESVGYKEHRCFINYRAQML
jgi:mycothiol synthase